MIYDIDAIRADFPILGRQVYGKPLVYLDNGATTQKPRMVVDAITEEYYSVNANVHRGVHYLSQEATKLHEASRERVRQFINAASTNEIIFTRGTTEAINLLASSFGEAFLHEGDEVIVLAPFFPEYRVFAEKAGAKLVVVQSDPKDFQIDFAALEAAISEKTKAIIVNSPNNPTGAVLTLDTLNKLAELLEDKQREYGHDIYIISDEPYRELVYDGVKVPYLTKYYDDTVVCYSYSKSLSLPGERIGYALVCPRMADFLSVYQAIAGAGRALGFVCAPSLLQKLLPAVLGKVSDIAIYDRNRRLLMEKLSEYGIESVKPEGAFYLFIKSPSGGSSEFCERAKKFEILLVPSDDFGCPGYFRLCYCVSYEMIQKSLPVFASLV